MGLHAEISTRLSGSSDLYEHTGRLPSASINFVTAHDGFTLADLVAYQQKHNEANLDGNHDGTDDNNSWNCGAEGPTGDSAILALRDCQRRNFWATLLLSQGVPMITSGDEFGRTQKGNNNAYCQDNELTWLDWTGLEAQRAFLDFACRVVAIRRKHPSFRRRSFKNKVPGTESVPSVRWFRADGKEMESDDWDNGGWMRTIGMLLDGDAPEIRDPEEIETKDDDFFLVLNAHHEPVDFRLPPEMARFKWTVYLNTVQAAAGGEAQRCHSAFTIGGRSLLLLRHERRRMRAKERP
jgi:glycogen operon protein